MQIQAQYIPVFSIPAHISRPHTMLVHSLTNTIPIYFNTDQYKLKYRPIQLIQVIKRLYTNFLILQGVWIDIYNLDYKHFNHFFAYNSKHLLLSV